MSVDDLKPAFAFATEGFLLAWTDANNRLCTKRFRRRREADRAYYAMVNAKGTDRPLMRPFDSHGKDQNWYGWLRKGGRGR